MDKEGKIDCIILAGGKGTRLSPIIGNDLKTMIRFSQNPLLFHQIKRLLKNQKVGRIWVIIPEGYSISHPFSYSKVRIIKEEKRDGTAGAIKKYAHFIESEDVLVIYGDIMFNMDIDRFIQYHLDNKASATLAVRPTDHILDSDLVKIDKENNIIDFIKRPMGEERERKHSSNAYYDNLANTGIFIINKRVIKKICLGEDFSQHIWPKIAQKKAYYTTEYIKDIGTPYRYRKTQTDYRKGRINMSTLAKPRPAIFLDRDGVINKLKHHLTKWEDFEFNPGVLAAIERINRYGFLAIIVTNQPVVAKGLCSIERIEEIHRKMKWEMGVYGCYVDQVYFCPHHPDIGYLGENPEFKIDCKCRKPKIGMFEQACLDFNIDLENAWMIGDTLMDAEFAENAGLRFFMNKERNLYRYVSRITA